MTFTLRDYQEDLEEAIRFGHQEYESIAIEEATGLGKTVSFVHYAAHYNQYATERRRVMVIVPQITLLGQAAKKIQRVTGIMPAIEQADQWSNESEWGRSDFIVASKQSLCSQERYKRFKDVGLVIVDECVTGDTMIHTNVGRIRIDNFPSSGVTHVYSYNGTRVEESRVKAWIPKGTQTTRIIELRSGQSIRCTDDHLIYTENGWTKARDVQCGDRVLTKNGQRSTTSSQNRHPCANAAVENKSNQHQAMSTHSSDGMDIGNTVNTSRDITYENYHQPSLQMGKRKQFLELFSAIPPSQCLTATQKTPESMGIIQSNNSHGQSTKPSSFERLEQKSRLLEMQAMETRLPDTQPPACRVFTQSLPLQDLSWVKNRFRGSGSTSYMVSDSLGGYVTTDRATEGTASNCTPKDLPTTNKNLWPIGFRKPTAQPTSSCPIEDIATSVCLETQELRSLHSSTSISRHACDTSWSDVVSIRTAELASVYDIEVEQNHCFFANDILVHNCHYCATESYAELLGYFRGLGAKVLGVSATLKRNDKLALGQCFDECVFQYGIQEAIADGWLVPLHVTCKQLKSLNLKGVGTTSTQFGNDFNQKELNERLENVEVIYEIAAAVAAETRRQKTAIFCSSVEEARAVSDLLEDQYGIRSGWISADTKRCTKQEREERLRSFVDPEGITHCANVGILSVGWDYPALECIVMARPTKSLPLYQQIIGRITRPIEGSNGSPVVDFDGSTSVTRQAAIRTSKKPCGRVIDLVDNSLEHKIITAADVLGGRWELLQRDDEKHVCRFCLKELSSRMSLSLHVTANHEEESEHVQMKGLEEVREEDAILNERLRKQRAKLKAAAEFHDQQVDPFGKQQNSSRGRSQAVMASKKQQQCLWAMGLKEINDYRPTKSQASTMIFQLKKMSVDAVKNRRPFIELSQQGQPN